MSLAYQQAQKAAGGCPIEAGILAKLADNECVHGRLPGDRTPPCGCWGTPALLHILPAKPARARRRTPSKPPQRVAA